MKKIFKFSLLALFLGVMSCEDATDIIQKDEMSEEEAYNTLTNLQQGLNGVYAAYSPDAGSNGSGYDAILFNDLFTDNLKRGMSSSGQGSQEYNFILQPLSDFPTQIWGNRYATINFANRVLRAWDRIVPTLSTTEREAADHIKGQLLGMRALCHLDLLMYFTEDYQNLSGPSVIIMDFVPEITQVFPRNTAGEVYDFINTDLDNASELMGSFNSELNPFFLTQDALVALRARMAITKGDYVLAGQLASQLTTRQLAEDDAYRALWTDAEQPEELIFALSRRANTDGFGITDLYSPNGPGENGNPFFEASNELYFSYANNDIRKEVFFFDQFSGTDVTTIDSPDNIILIGKYRGSGDGTKVNDVKVLRVTEMYLIKAEAEARAGNFTAAAATVRQVRMARTTTGANPPLPNYNGSLELALVDIALERRKEFAFEGHRYLDLKRLGEEIGEGVTRLDVDCASFSAQQCNLLPGDYRFTLPIPRTEINANPTIQQNTGY